MRIFLAVIFLALLGYALSFVLFVSNLPVAPAIPPKADGIVALTGGDERLDTAVALLERGVGKRLLVSGVAAFFGLRESDEGDEPGAEVASAGGASDHPSGRAGAR